MKFLTFNYLILALKWELRRIFEDFVSARVNNEFWNDGTRDGWTKNLRAPRSLMAANLRLMRIVHNNITHILVIVPSVSIK